MMKIKVTSFRYMLKYFGPILAFKWLFTGSISFDTNYPTHFWTFKKGIQYDYTNARLITNTLNRDENGWMIFPIKPEGAPVEQEKWEWEGLKELGSWWSLKFHTRWFHIYYRHRSWTKDIFYITKD